MVSIEDKEILHDISLCISSGQLHVVMGPNGSGKSTLTQAIMGHPNYLVTRGQVLINHKNILKLPPEERAKRGLLLAFQNPIAIPGVTIYHFLRVAYRQLNPDEKFDALSFHKKMQETAKSLQIVPDMLKRSLNDGFSGGEKKKLEMLQLLVLKPKFAIFDEIDTGLDIDALQAVSVAIDSLQKSGCGVLLITHYQRILNHLTIDFLHVLKSGKLVKEGGRELLKQIEEKGYDAI